MTTTSADKGIAKTLQKLKASVEAGNYYEAHQMYRTVANRYMKQDKHASVVELTFSGALILLQHGQSGSGSDLALYMLDGYLQGKVAVTAESLGRVIDLLDHYPPEEPGRKPFITKAVSWTQEQGDFPQGDPELHHYVGVLLWKEHQYLEAETHLLVGTEESARFLGQLEYDWAVHLGASDKGVYIARAVLQFLCLKNVRDANASFNTFASLLEPNPTTNVPYKLAPAADEPTTDVAVYRSPMTNFVHLVLFTVQRDATDMYRMLVQKYKPVWGIVSGGQLEELLNRIGEVFFHIQRPRAQGNALADLMSSLFTPQPTANRPSVRPATSSAPRLGGGPMSELD